MKKIAKTREKQCRTEKSNRVLEEIGVAEPIVGVKYEIGSELTTFCACGDILTLKVTQNGAQRRK